MPAFSESVDDTFTYATDWKEVVESASSPASAHLSNDAHEATLTGLVPWSKQRSCARHFLGFAEAGGAPQFRLNRENPKAHPIFPWLFASDVSFTPFLVESNPADANGSPKKAGVFDANLNVALYNAAVATVRYRNFRFRYMSDGDIPNNQSEWKRNTYFDTEPSIEALQVTGGFSQLTFAESAGGQPPANTRFPAPVAALLSKASLMLNWINVPWEYLSEHTFIFQPTKILSFVGTVNSEVMFSDGAHEYGKGTLLFQPPRWSIKDAPVASANTRQPLRYVDLQLRWDHFDPEKGVPASIYRGHNLMPWGGDGTAANPGNGKFYMATRDGNLTGVLTTENSLLRYADHQKIFEHVSE